MKYKIITFLLLGITIILCFTYFRQRQEISKLNAQPKVIGKTDTVYVSKPFKPVKAYNTQVLPNYIFLYGSDQKKRKSSSVPVNVDNVNNPDSIHQEDSLVQILLSKKDINLSFFRPSTEDFITKQFSLDLDKYKYNWVNGKLTQEKVRSKLKLIPYVYVKYRYFHKMVDSGLGISFETRNLQYKLGLNGFYYPCLQDKLGTDLELSITYNLK